MRIVITRNIKEWIPETYLFLSVLYYWTMTGTVLNPIAVILILILGLLFWSKSQILGWIIAFVFLLLNSYMILAMIDEVLEFREFTGRALQLLIGGTCYLGLNIFFSIRMLVKWGRKM